MREKHCMILSVVEGGVWRRATQCYLEAVLLPMCARTLTSLAGASMRRTCTSWTPWGSRRQNMLGTLHLYCDNLTCASSLTSSTRGRRQLLETLGAKEITHAWVVFLFCDSSRCARTFASLTLGACSLISFQRKITNMQGDLALPKETLLLYSSSKHLKGHLSVHVSTLFVSEVFSGNLLPLFGPSVHKYMEDASTIGHLKI